MATTTFSGPVVSQNGFTGGVSATTTFLQVPTATAAQIASAASTINTVGKVVGSVVFDTTNNKFKIAVGALATSNWVDDGGLNPVTPS